ncbi:hypothetical protein AB0F92_31675 [Kitasatospora aureofaciens]|uniref:hypothetical protein n=1 Tax=Kitasatospora aureofaciens TaxID=1894 RepID=UPI0033C531ED
MTATPVIDNMFSEQVTELIDAGRHSGGASVFGESPGLCLVRMSTLVHLAGHQKAMRRVVLDVTQRLEVIPDVRHFPTRLPNNGRELICLYRTTSMAGALIEAILAAPAGVDDRIAAALGLLGGFTRRWQPEASPNKHAS